jgi:F0F1-type ATP synthase assembly protein I
MSWRLAVAILIPIFIGLKLDSHFGTKPSYVLAGFMLAIALASYMIYVEYREIQADQAAQDMKLVKKTSKKKGTA